ncbi:MAG: radical SAM protein [Syntrophobacterales bacterium]|nr:MAG: radical SAM protein [Syntrophobacterales bacterium]
MRYTFEQGPIRPPNEAYSLLIRVARNCPWNRCAFCRTYKGERFSTRSVDEVKEDIKTVREISQEIKAISWNEGLAGEIDASMVQTIFDRPDLYNEAYRRVALWLYGGGKHVFLQDADSLRMRADDLTAIIAFLKDTFPDVQRITTYARSKTVYKTALEKLEALHEAGLSRLHIGLESGYDRLLAFMKKGVTAREHIEAGKKVKASGLELSEYVILGLGGKGMWKPHAIKTAKVLNQIAPHFIRVRTLKVLRDMPLYGKVEANEFVLSSDDEIIREEGLLIDGLHGIKSYFTSDHILNLLEEVEGQLPGDKHKMRGIIDRYLILSEEEKLNYRLGRRAGIYRKLDDLNNPMLFQRVQDTLKRIGAASPQKVEETIADLMERYI